MILKPYLGKYDSCNLTLEVSERSLGSCCAVDGALSGYHLLSAVPLNQYGGNRNFYASISTKSFVFRLKSYYSLLTHCSLQHIERFFPFCPLKVASRTILSCRGAAKCENPHLDPLLKQKNRNKKGSSFTNSGSNACKKCSNYCNAGSTQRSEMMYPNTLTCAAPRTLYRSSSLDYCPISC